MKTCSLQPYQYWFLILSSKLDTTLLDKHQIQRGANMQTVQHSEKYILYRKADSSKHKYLLKSKGQQTPEIIIRLILIYDCTRLMCLKRV